MGRQKVNIAKSALFRCETMVLKEFHKLLNLLILFFSEEERLINNIGIHK